MKNLWKQILIQLHNFKDYVISLFDEDLRFKKRKKQIKLRLTKLNADCNGFANWIIRSQDIFYKYVIVAPESYAGSDCIFKLYPNTPKIKLWYMVRQAKHTAFLQTVASDPGL